jgi:hypothetical protein
MMSTQTVYTRPMKTVIFGFLGFTAAAMALALGEKMGLLDAATVKRGMGLILGVTVIITGNFLPKTRPLNAPGVNPSGAAAAAERFAGWTLVLVGIAYVALFAIAPLDRARTVSSILGIGAMVLIASNWAWLVRGALLGSRETSEETAPERAFLMEKRRLIVPLLFAFFYTFATACTVFLLHDRHQIDEASWWLFLGFWLIYAFLMVVLEPKKRCSK